MEEFRSVQELTTWLHQNGINPSDWGVTHTKSIDNLWRELKSGDAYLQSAPPMRVVNVVQVFIRHNNLLLLETIQELANGHRRYRNQPPAEKIMRGENYLDAAYRGLHEELGIPPERIMFNLQSHLTRTLITESPSYPGLPTHYTFHNIEATVRGLPLNNFWHDNRAFKQGDPIKRHFWAWCPPEEMNSLSV